MELINATRMVAGYTMGLEPSGRESLVVIIKGTFVLPKLGEAVRLHDQQIPLMTVDTFTAEPGFSAPVYEMDFAQRKQACDILLLGSAYAPGGQPALRVEVALCVGQTMQKRFQVVGDRTWDAGFAKIRPTPPIPFTQMPFSYDVAFGGVDQESDDPSEHDAYACNPVGRGFRKHLKHAWVDGKPLPNTEQLDEVVASPTGKYRPMAFGPIGRGWTGRVEHAGTYDDKWLDEVFPFLPKNFDARYFQVAPVDQQIQMAEKPLEVMLRNLTPDGMRQFVLPYFEAPVHVFPKNGKCENLTAVLDTVIIEPDHERLTMTWRVTRPLKKSLFEIAQVMVGRKGRDWWQEREKLTFPIPVVMVPMRRGPQVTAES